MSFVLHVDSFCLLSSPLAKRPGLELLSYQAAAACAGVWPPHCACSPKAPWSMERKGVNHARSRVLGAWHAGLEEECIPVETKELLDTQTLFLVWNSQMCAGASSFNAYLYPQTPLVRVPVPLQGIRVRPEYRTEGAEPVASMVKQGSEVQTPRASAGNGHDPNHWTRGFGPVLRPSLVSGAR